MGGYPKAVVDDEGFCRDWEEGMYLKDMAEKHNISISYVSHHAIHHLDLKPRKPRNKNQFALTGGRWVQGAGRIQRWVEHGQAGT